MKVAVALFLLVAVAFAASAELSLRNLFVEFQHKYDRHYSSEEEFERRFEIFVANFHRAQELNQLNGEAGPAFGINKFSDMSPEEFRSKWLMTKTNFPEVNTVSNVHVAVPTPTTNPPSPPCVYDAVANPPTSFDWRESGKYVTPVYNQGECGSCWAFSTTEAIESAWALAGNPLTQLSMQQIVSCDTNDYGCSGGWPYTAYQYVEKAGLEGYSDYPYASGGGTAPRCKYNKADVVAQITGYCFASNVTHYNESNMALFIASVAPLSICVDASSWQSYTGGVVTARACGRQVDHCVQAVGYGVTTGSKPVNYWLVRNSWGTDWGTSGYLFVERGNNACAIAEYASCPTVEGLNITVGSTGPSWRAH